ncbi:hypothetical protein ElyMa_001005400 [Elysia marginata]|uniref:Uncharacterized protein n=1 Tax=Elysia marginata TaxID=1093978 RepID=A0AAV4HJ60_9GAST|nr:hypothetical protein ElyMa_001005400 [Elysia marginata]
MKSAVGVIISMKTFPIRIFLSRHFVRLYSAGVQGVVEVDKSQTFRVAYQYSLGISDPTVFNKDLSACVPVDPSQ